MNRSINEERKRKQERKREKGERERERGEGRREEERKYSFFSSAPLTNFHVQSTIFKILAPAAGSVSHPRSARIRKPTPGSGFAVP